MQIHHSRLKTGLSVIQLELGDKLSGLVQKMKPELIAAGQVTQGFLI